MAAATGVTKWLLKAEPLPHVVGGRDVGSFPFSRVAACPDATAPFNGVRNYTARNNLRDRIKLGHTAFYYHASCKEPGIAGIVTIARAGYPDPDAADASHPFYDAKHTAAAPRWYNVDVRAARPLTRFVSLTELRTHSGADGPLRDMALFRQSRLSVQPVTDAEWAFIVGLEAGAPAAAAAAAPKAPRVRATVGGAGVEGTADGTAVAAVAAAQQTGVGAGRGAAAKSRGRAAPQGAAVRAAASAAAASRKRRAGAPAAGPQVAAAAALAGSAGSSGTPAAEDDVAAASSPAAAQAASKKRRR